MKVLGIILIIIGVIVICIAYSVHTEIDQPDFPLFLVGMMAVVSGGYVLKIVSEEERMNIKDGKD